MQYTPEQLIQHLSDSGRKLADLTANMVYDDPELLKNLIKLMWLDKDPWSNRASRVVSICCCNFPEMVQPYAAGIVTKLGRVRSEGVIRNMLKIFAEVPVKLSEKSQSVLMNLCFDYLFGNPPVAIKVYSMEVLYSISRNYPDLLRELYEVIDSQLSEGSAGFKSRGNKILKRIRDKI